MTTGDLFLAQIFVYCDQLFMKTFDGTNFGHWEYQKRCLDHLGHLGKFSPSPPIIEVLLLNGEVSTHLDTWVFPAGKSAQASLEEICDISKV